jgi:hypothetical protein
MTAKKKTFYIVLSFIEKGASPLNTKGTHTMMHKRGEIG